MDEAPNDALPTLSDAARRRVVVTAVVLLNGRLDGDVHAAERVELAANARVQGNVHYRVVEMNAGAQLTGRLVHADAGSSVVAMPVPELVAVAR